MDTCYGVKLSSSAMIEGRKVPVSNYYVGRGKDGPRTSAKPHNAALMTETLAELLVTKLNKTGHHAEVCELLADETSTIQAVSSFEDSTVTFVLARPSDVEEPAGTSAGRKRILFQCHLHDAGLAESVNILRYSHTRASQRVIPVAASPADGTTGRLARFELPLDAES